MWSLLPEGLLTEGDSLPHYREFRLRKEEFNFLIVIIVMGRQVSGSVLVSSPLKKLVPRQSISSFDFDLARNWRTKHSPRELVLSAGYDDIVRTLVYSGRPMRVRKTAYVAEW